ncbi:MULTISPECIES: DUF3649 domain-containing protein [unclassified Pseudomonas]|jgi:hypothetical protein|uniref:DUF3649 domain-containing protein n=1 Tax=unclassified Pseudomonas TaxID=196821 RepID=UPI0002709548|nr:MULTISPECIES: DUF3649 domain-containing protein [unclassified Pseudomonas]EJM84254.1 hypothetical protein PMI33_04005 [Pseudomonas sp. GM67]MBD9548792.1 DUF3649 domain-containing protein [Pseudomonas sp. PDM01]UCP09173.1 DUF3649 domain-containing protein [Pseudomonas sp. MM213]
MKVIPVSYRLAVTSRVLAAVLGGYIVAALASVSLTLWVPMARADAVVTGMMTSFLAYLGAVIWCFACRSAWRAWLGLIVPSLVLAAISGLAYWMGRT